MNKWKIYCGYRKIVSAVFPNICPFCEGIIGADEFLCGRCEKSLPYAKDTLCPPENIARFYACCYYIKRVRTAVYMMKFGGSVYPVDAFAVMMNKMLSDELKSADMLVPVPSGSKGISRRGFAPAEMIADRLSWNSNIPVIKALKAKSGKIDQKDLSMIKRAENAKHSFYPDTNADLRGKRIILVDDVCTTGSTLSACAEILLNAGAAEVVGAVFAKTLKCTYSKMPRGRFSIKNAADHCENENFYANTAVRR